MENIETTIQDVIIEEARVTREHAEHQAAIAAQRDAEAAVFDRVIEVMRPALPAITDRVMTHDPGCALTTAEDGEELSPKVLTRAIRVACGDETCDYEARLRSTGGVPIEGEDLWLTREGALVVIDYRGTSNQWANVGAGVARTMRAVTSREAMDTYRLDVIIGNLLDALRADKRTEATKEARERTVKLEALMALIG